MDSPTPKALKQTTLDGRFFTVATSKRGRSDDETTVASSAKSPKIQKTRSDKNKHVNDQAPSVSSVLPEIKETKEQNETDEKLQTEKNEMDISVPTIILPPSDSTVIPSDIPDSSKTNKKTPTKPRKRQSVAKTPEQPAQPAVAPGSSGSLLDGSYWNIDTSGGRSRRRTNNFAETAFSQTPSKGGAAPIVIEGVDTQGWPEARKKAYLSIEKNPNAYYFRFLAVGEKSRTGKWTEEEKKSFLEKFVAFAPKKAADYTWGLFSMQIPGRTGCDCSNFYKKLLKAGEVQDKHFTFDEQGEPVLKKLYKASQKKREDNEKRAQERRAENEAKKKQAQEDKAKKEEETRQRIEEDLKGKEIIAGLYLGNKRVAKNYDWILENNVKYVLNATKEIRNYFEEDDEIKYKRLGVSDGEKGFGGFFEESHEFIRNALEANTSVLVHCAEGRSRSVTILVSYLMKHLGWDLRSSFDHLRTKNPRLNIHDEFKQELMNFETSLKKESSMDYLGFCSPSRMKLSSSSLSAPSSQGSVPSPKTSPRNLRASSQQNVVVETTSNEVPQN